MKKNSHFTIFLLLTLSSAVYSQGWQKVSTDYPEELVLILKKNMVGKLSDKKTVKNEITIMQGKSRERVTTFAQDGKTLLDSANAKEIALFNVLQDVEAISQTRLRKKTLIEWIDEQINTLEGNINTYRKNIEKIEKQYMAGLSAYPQAVVVYGKKKINQKEKREEVKKRILTHIKNEAVKAVDGFTVSIYQENQSSQFVESEISVKYKGEFGAQIEEFQKLVGNDTYLYYYGLFKVFPLTSIEGMKQEPETTNFTAGDIEFGAIYENDEWIKEFRNNQTDNKKVQEKIFEKLNDAMNINNVFKSNIYTLKENRNTQVQNYIQLCEDIEKQIVSLKSDKQSRLKEMNDIDKQLIDLENSKDQISQTLTKLRDEDLQRMKQWTEYTVISGGSYLEEGTEEDAFDRAMLDAVKKFKEYVYEGAVYHVFRTVNMKLAEDVSLQFSGKPVILRVKLLGLYKEQMEEIISYNAAVAFEYAYRYDDDESCESKVKTIAQRYGNNRQEAITLLEELARHEPGCKAVLFDLTSAYLNEKNYMKSYNTCVKLIQLDLDDYEFPDALFYIAYSYYLQYEVLDPDIKEFLNIYVTRNQGSYLTEANRLLKLE